jgi:hypothetical protein
MTQGQSKVIKNLSDEQLRQFLPSMNIEQLKHLNSDRIVELLSDSSDGSILKQFNGIAGQLLSVLSQEQQKKCFLENGMNLIKQLSPLDVSEFAQWFDSIHIRQLSPDQLESILTPGQGSHAVKSNLISHLTEDQMKGLSSQALSDALGIVNGTNSDPKLLKKIAPYLKESQLALLFGTDPFLKIAPELTKEQWKIPSSMIDKDEMSPLHPFQAQLHKSKKLLQKYLDDNLGDDGVCLICHGKLLDSTGRINEPYIDNIEVKDMSKNLLYHTIASQIDDKAVKVIHAFHRGCLDAWLNMSGSTHQCPICKKTLLQGSVIVSHTGVDADARLFLIDQNVLDHLDLNFTSTQRHSAAESTSCPHGTGVSDVTHAVPSLNESVQKVLGQWSITMTN